MSLPSIVRLSACFASLTDSSPNFNAYCSTASFNACFDSSLTLAAPACFSNDSITANGINLAILTIIKTQYKRVMQP